MIHQKNARQVFAWARAKIDLSCEPRPSQPAALNPGELRQGWVVDMAQALTYLLMVCVHMGMSPKSNETIRKFEIILVRKAILERVTLELTHHFWQGSFNAGAFVRLQTRKIG